jgi:hypothetical protein
VLHALHRAIITSPSPLPDIEFTFFTSDIADPEHLQKKQYGHSRAQPRSKKSGSCLILGSGAGLFTLSEDMNKFDFRSRNQSHIFGQRDDRPYGEVLSKQTSIEKNCSKLQKAKTGPMWRGLSRQAHKIQSLVIILCQYQFLIHTEGKAIRGINPVSHLTPVKRSMANISS